MVVAGQSCACTDCGHAFACGSSPLWKRFKLRPYPLDRRCSCCARSVRPEWFALRRGLSRVAVLDGHKTGILRLGFSAVSHRPSFAGRLLYKLHTLFPGERSAEYSLVAASSGIV